MEFRGARDWNNPWLLCKQPRERDLSVWVNTVLIEQIDNIGPESLQRSVGDLFDVLSPAVDANWRTAVWIEFEPEFRGDHHLLAEGSKGFAHELLVDERAVNFSRI